MSGTAVADPPAPTAGGGGGETPTDKPTATGN